MLGTDAGAIARLRAALARAAYDSTGLKRAFGQERIKAEMYVETMKVVLPA
jgi:hypothetical protein